MIITPELIQDINSFIAALNDRFSPPQFIPGCLVKSVADKDEYATNNGWIEAICGQHNQQRVRWKSNDTVAVNDFIDVLYFPDRRLFEAYGLGGSTPIPSGGGWPFVKVHTVSPTDTDAQYSSIASAIAAASAGDIILIDAGSYTEQLTINKALSLVGLSPQQTIITIGTNDSITVDITAANVTLRNLKIANTGAGTTTVNVRTNSNNTLITNCLIEKISGVPTTAIGIRSIGGTPNIIRSCDFNITTGTTKRLIVADTAATGVIIEHGTLDGSGVSVYTNHASAVVTLNYPRVLTSAPSNNAGLLQGHYLQTNGHVVTLQGSGRMGQCWIHQADGFVIYYNTIATALAASGAGDIIFIGAGTYYEQLTVSLAVTLVGLDPQNTIITYDAGATIALTGAGASLRNLTIENTGAGGVESTCVQWDVDNVIIQNCILIKTGAASTGSCLLPYGGTGWKVINCELTAGGATNNYAIQNIIATTSGEIRGGKLNGTIFSNQSLTVLQGWYLDSSGKVVGVDTDNLFINGGPQVWQRSTDTTVTTTRKYVADQWAVTTGAGTLANVRRSTTVRTGARSRYSMELVGATGVTTVDIDQRIEAAEVVARYKSYVAFSAYVYNGSGAAFTPKLLVSTPSVIDNWGTNTVRNGAGSGEDLQSCTDAAWTLVTWMADISGYTNIDNGVQFKLRIPSGSLVAGDTVRLAEMNLTTGPLQIVYNPIPYSVELAMCQRYCYLLDVANTPLAFRASTRWIEVKFYLPTSMRLSNPTLTHNITGWTGGAPATTTVAFLNYNTGAYTTITGALTIRTLTAGRELAQIEYEAATSFNGTAGDIGEAYFGPSVVAYWDAAL